MISFRKVIVLGLALAKVGLAQPESEIRQRLHSDAELVRIQYSISQSMLNMAQMANDPQAYQLAQHELRYHQQFFEYLQGLTRNPQQLRQPASQKEYQARLDEYCYRTHQRDYRPYPQIAEPLRQWLAYRRWEASTPEGQQAFQVRMQQSHQDFEDYMCRRRQEADRQERYNRQWMRTILGPSRPSSSRRSRHY